MCSPLQPDCRNHFLKTITDDGRFMNTPVQHSSGQDWFEAHPCGSSISPAQVAYSEICPSQAEAPL
jgi:hypothetical protein